MIDPITGRDHEAVVRQGDDQRVRVPASRERRARRCTLRVEYPSRVERVGVPHDREPTAVERSEAGPRAAFRAARRHLLAQRLAVGVEQPVLDVLPPVLPGDRIAPVAQPGNRGVNGYAALDEIDEAVRNRIYHPDPLPFRHICKKGL